MYNILNPNLKKICKDYSLIENFEKAITDKNNKYHLHHRKEITENKSMKQLKAEGKYYDVSPEDLIFLTVSEHLMLHKAGSVFSDEHKTKLSQAHKGKIFSEEHKKNISTSVKNHEKKPVLQFSFDGDLIAEFESITQAYKITKIKKYNISQVCNGKTHTAGGFKWEFA